MVTPIDIVAEMLDAVLHNRCPICHGELKSSVDEGCVLGNCSLRDDHTDMSYIYARRREVLAAFKSLFTSRWDAGGAEVSTAPPA